MVVPQVMGCLDHTQLQMRNKLNVIEYNRRIPAWDDEVSQGSISRDQSTVWEANGQFSTARGKHEWIVRRRSNTKRNLPEGKVVVVELRFRGDERALQCPSWLVRMPHKSCAMVNVKPRIWSFGWDCVSRRGCQVRQVLRRIHQTSQTTHLQLLDKVK